MPKASETAGRQIATLKRLTQGAAAHLASLTPRALRDTDCPRNRDGTYDARQLVRWARSRTERPDLTDAELERIAIVAECGVLMPASDHAQAAAEEHLAVLVEKYGDGGALAFMDALRERWREHAEVVRSLPSEDPAAEAARVAEAEARDRLRISVQCQNCKRVRCGPKWARASPLAGYAIVRGMCPTCTEKGERL